VLALGAAFSCDCSSAIDADRRFVCGDDAHCAPGFECRGGVCEVAGGAAGGGVSTAGGGATAGGGEAGGGATAGGATAGGATAGGATAGGATAGGATAGGATAGGATAGGATAGGATAGGATAGGATAGGATAGGATAGGATAGGGVSPGDVRVYYAVSPGGHFHNRTWNGTSWSPAVDGPPEIPATVKFIVARPAATGDVVVALGHDGMVGGVGVFEEIAGTWSQPWTAAGISVADTGRRGFDLAVETVSRRPVVAYATGGAAMKYRVRGASGWSSEADVFPMAPGTGTIQWVDLVEHPSTDELTLLYADSANDLFAATWSGTGWSPATTLETGLNTRDWQCFGGAYEPSSADLLVVWSRYVSTNALGTMWATRAAGSSTFSMPTQHGNLTRPGPLALAPDTAATNRIALGYVEFTCMASTCDDFYAGHWTGSAWVAPSSPLNPDIQYSYLARIGTMPAGAGWVGSTGIGVAVYSQAQPGLNWARYSPSTNAWTNQTDATMSPPLAEQTSFQVLTPRAGAQAVLVIMSDTLGGLWAKKYDGSTWSNTEGGAALDTGLSTTTGQPWGAYAR